MLKINIWNTLNIWKNIYVKKQKSYLKNMADENISPGFRLQNINETRNYLIEEVNPNEFMSKKYKKVWKH